MIGGVVWDEYEGLHVVGFPSIDNISEFLGNNDDPEDTRLLCYWIRLTDEMTKKIANIYDDALFTWVIDYQWFLKDLKRQFPVMGEERCEEKEKPKEKVLVCQYCGQRAEALILMAMMVKCGAVIHPPPDWCPDSPDHEHRLVYVEVERK